jgi:spore maturation protein CgeB
MSHGLRIAFFGSSIVSSYWNDACTYYRGIVRALHERGHQLTFYEPDAYERQQHRDIDDPPWARVIVCEPTAEAAAQAVASAAQADVLIRASGVGVCDRELEARVQGFFLGAVERLPEPRFILGGSGWSADALQRNVRLLGHVPTRMHSVLNVSSLAVLNISRESMASNGSSPATRVFEAAGAGACLITDRCEGIERFLEPRSEAEHTYTQRAEQLEQVLTGALSGGTSQEGVR